MARLGRSFPFRPHLAGLIKPSGYTQSLTATATATASIATFKSRGQSLTATATATATITLIVARSQALTATATATASMSRVVVIRNPTLLAVATATATIATAVTVAFVPVPSYAVGRRLPEFKLLLYDPLTSPALTRQSSRIDLSPDIESLSFSTQPDGGFTALSVGYDKFIKFPDGEERHFGRLQQPAQLRDFAHIALTEGKRIIWEGRALLPDFPGGRLKAFQAKGYGYTGLLDNPYLNTSTAEQTSGQIFREAVASCAPTLTIGGPSKYVDPGVYHPYNSFNYQYPSQILQQLLTDGDNQGNQLVYTVYEGRIVSLVPQTAPTRPTYIVDFTDDVDWQRNMDGCYGAVYYQYSGGSQPAIYVECPQSLATWTDQHGGLSRVASVSGGTLTDAEALAKATTWIKQASNPAIAATFAIGGRFFGDVQGMRLASGGTRAPWLVRSGETVQVGDQGAYYIVSTNFDCNTLQLSVSLGQLAFGQNRMMARLRTIAGHVTANTNAVSGSAN